MSAPVQLALDLPHRTATGAADFLVASSNRDAVALLDRWPAWPGPALVLHGPEGCGKTHLTHVWRAQSGAVAIDRQVLTGCRVPELLGGARCAVVEDVDRGVDERGLLHLHNLLAEDGGHLLLTARLGPAAWGTRLPDLASRLGAAMAVVVGAPDDALIGAVLVKHFADRQLAVDPAVITFLLARMERSFAAARDLATALDSAALAAKRKITVPLAREVLRQFKDEPD